MDMQEEEEAEVNMDASNNELKRMQDWMDLFITPDIPTMHIWSYLQKIDLITMASMDDDIKECVLRFHPNLFEPIRENSLNPSSTVSECLTAAQLDVVFTFYKDVEVVHISSQIHTSLLLKSLGRMKNLHDLEIEISDSHEYEEYNLSVNKLALYCDFQAMNMFHRKDPIHNLLSSVEDVHHLKLFRGFLSKSSIDALKKFRFKELAFIRTSVLYNNYKYFVKTFFSCDLNGLTDLKIVLSCLRLSHCYGAFNAQSMILQKLHEYAPNIIRLDITASTHRLNASRLHRISSLRYLRVYLNYWCCVGVFNSLLRLVTRLTRQQVEIHIVLYDVLDIQMDPRYHERRDLVSELHKINPEIVFIDRYNLGTL